MKTSFKTAELIRQRISETSRGEPFSPVIFLECGTRASVDQTLSRLVKTGSILRIARGLFVRPEVSRFANKVLPEPFKIAETLARMTGATIQVHGAEAARQLGLSTQVPVRPIFLTSGRSRHIRFGKMEIHLQHVCQRKLALAGRPAGLALIAMWYLGKNELTPQVIEKIKRGLLPDEFLALKAASKVMPAWMSDVFFRYERAAQYL